ncbi:MAG: amidohydrolase family protein [Hyphomicrobiales bacterium]
MPFHFRNTFELADVDEAVEWKRQYADDMLHSGRVKLFIDGVMETLTAQMLDDYPGFPGNKGAPLYTPERFAEIVMRADGHGLQVSTHAIGDGGVRTTIDAYEAARKKNGMRDSRHRIEHIELIDPSDIPRLAQLGIVASLQPIAGVGVPGISGGAHPLAGGGQAALCLCMADDPRHRGGGGLFVGLAGFAA